MEKVVQTEVDCASNKIFCIRTLANLFAESFSIHLISDAIYLPNKSSVLSSAEETWTELKLDFFPDAIISRRSPAFFKIPLSSISLFCAFVALDSLSETLIGRFVEDVVETF